MASRAPFPKPGTLLWGLEIELARDVFRSGAATKPNVEYLRFRDIGVDRDGRIEDGDNHSVEVGKGISLFLERKIPEGMVAMSAEDWKAADKKKRGSAQWWSIEQKQPIPAGLEL